MAKKTNPHCPQCDAELSKKPKTSFWSGHKEYKCEKCGYQGGLPLWTSTRIVYWTITVLVLFILLELALGGSGNIGLLGLIAPWLLFKDWQTRKKIKEYAEENNIKSIPKLNEKNGVVKGIIYSAIVIVVTFALGALLYSDDTSLSPSSGITTTTSTRSVSNTNSCQSFHSTDGKFKVIFPDYPSESSSTERVEGMSIPTTQYGATASNGDEYMAQFVVYPVEPSDLNPKGALEGAVNGSVNSDANNQLVESAFTQFGSYPAIDYTIFTTTKKTFT